MIAENLRMTHKTMHHTLICHNYKNLLSIINISFYHLIPLTAFLKAIFLVDFVRPVVY